MALRREAGAVQDVSIDPVQNKTGDHNPPPRHKDLSPLERIWRSLQGTTGGIEVMTQGFPIQDIEYKFIWDTRDQFPSLVARHLSVNYSHINGGFRGKKTVAELQAEMNQYETFGEWRTAHITTKEERPGTTEPPKITLPDLRKVKKKKILA